MQIRAHQTVWMRMYNSLLEFTLINVKVFLESLYYSKFNVLLQMNQTSSWQV